MASRSRPLSPHLHIYKFTLTMAMSITHRITGVALYLGTLLIVVWLGAAALGAAQLALAEAVFGSWPGQIVLFLATWALFHHMLGGLRHFVWDFGLALDPKGREAIVRLQLGAAVLLTLAVWAFFVWFK